VDRFNLSDVFEYMSEENSHRLLDTLVKAANPGARLAYWNMLAPRRSPESMRGRIVPLAEEADRLHRADKAFFYSAFILEEIR
jgi:S-adenosylmethionine-diacylglycerol 3-amino-3-carboxypropyl transferase